MNLKKGWVVLAVLVSGCASLPDVTYRYYPARWSTSVTVTQTLGCNTAKDDALVVHAVGVSTSYSSDISKNPVAFRIKDLDRFAADVDMTLTLTDDGRLKGINQSTTGQGEAIIKSAIALEGAIGARPLTKMMQDVGRSGPTASQCDDIDKWGDKKPITLIYRTSINAKHLGTGVPIGVAEESRALFERFKAFLPTFSVHVDSADKVKEIGSRPVLGAPETDTVPLTLQKVGSLGISVQQDGGNRSVLTSRVLAPLDETYTLPIPKAALFGKQSFSLALSEAGAVTSIGYGRTSGVAGALNALGALAATQTAAAEAAELKAQADLILQQQRLVTCLTKPDQCK